MQQQNTAPRNNSTHIGICFSLAVRYSFGRAPRAFAELSPWEAAEMVFRVSCIFTLVLVESLANHTVPRSTVTWAHGASNNWSDWSNWNGNVGSAEHVIITAVSSVHVAMAHYSHAVRLTCNQSMLSSTSRLCIGPGCMVDQFAIAHGGLLSSPASSSPWSPPMTPPRPTAPCPSLPPEPPLPRSPCTPLPAMPPPIAESAVGIIIGASPWSPPMTPPRPTAPCPSLPPEPPLPRSPCTPLPAMPPPIAESAVGIIIGACAVALVSVGVVAVVALRFASQKRSPSNTAQPDLVQNDISTDIEFTYCTFYFVDADELRRCTDDVLPSLKELRKTRPSWIVKKTLSLKEALSGKYVEDHCAISHRWESPSQPDPDGAQMIEIREFLKENHRIKWIWYDFWCMLQGSRSDIEQAEFEDMLGNVNLLYLSARVLIIMDMSYMARFWTQFEAWLSMQEATEDGLVSAPEYRRRCVIKCTLLAKPHQESLAKILVQTWEGKTPAEVVQILGSNDVTVTNKRDKEIQLPKVIDINSEAMKICALAERRSKTNDRRRSSGESLVGVSTSTQVASMHDRPFAAHIPAVGPLGHASSLVPRQHSISTTSFVC